MRRDMSRQVTEWWEDAPVLVRLAVLALLVGVAVFGYTQTRTFQALPTGTPTAASVPVSTAFVQTLQDTQPSSVEECLIVGNGVLLAPGMCERADALGAFATSRRFDYQAAFAS